MGQSIQEWTFLCLRSRLLEIIFRENLENEIYSLVWKKLNLILIKKKDHRPYSVFFLWSVCGKNFDIFKRFFNEMFSFCIKNDLIITNQFSFKHEDLYTDHCFNDR